MAGHKEEYLHKGFAENERLLFSRTKPARRPATTTNDPHPLLKVQEHSLFDTMPHGLL